MGIRPSIWFVGLGMAICLTLATCHQPTSNHRESTQGKVENAVHSANDIFGELRKLSAQEKADMQKYFPISRYHGFPADV